MKGLWQAHVSPASLGFPLSVPAACGSCEIFHLKALSSYPTLIIPILFAFVKNHFIAQYTIPFLIINLHKCNNGIFIFWIINRGN